MNVDPNIVKNEFKVSHLLELKCLVKIFFDSLFLRKKLVRFNGNHEPNNNEMEKIKK